MRPICKLLEEHACIGKRVSAGLFGSSVRVRGTCKKRGGGLTERRMHCVRKIMTEPELRGDKKCY